MKILLKSVTIIDKTSPFHNSVQDVFIENGIIKNISNSISGVSVDKEITGGYISQGWADSSVCFGEPGFEDNETLQNGMQVAAKSGFTQILLNPKTQPVTDTKSAIAFLKNETKNAVSQLFPIGALTTQSTGEYLAELYDMQQAGAVAFGDFKKTISNANLLKIAFQYAQNFDGIIISFANDKTIAGKGVVNEHFVSTRLGLKGIPTLAEEIIVERDLAILEYTGGKLHIPTISSEKSVNLIRQAKQKGLDVSCSVAIHNIHLSDALLNDFNTNYKVLPPLRNDIHIQALKSGILDGTIDFVTSDHTPINIEEKQIEFDLASYGTIGLESAFGILIQHFSVEKSVELLTNAKSRFQLPTYSINIGQPADITIFTTEGNTIFEEKNSLSTSKNSAFFGQNLKGKVIGIITQNGVLFN